MDDHRRYQILLGRARGALLDAAAQASGQRATAFIRDLLYAWLERTTPPEQYDTAKRADLDDREAAVRRQVAGRKP